MGGIQFVLFLHLSLILHKPFHLLASYRKYLIIMVLGLFHLLSSLVLDIELCPKPKHTLLFKGHLIILSHSQCTTETNKMK